MYAILLDIHSLVRWAVLCSLLFALWRGCRGMLKGGAFTTLDEKARRAAVSAAHIQLVLGLWLYFISPLVTSFFDNFEIAVRSRDLRFFAMEHSLMMFTAVIFISIGSVRSKRKTEDARKFKTMVTWFTLAFIFILVAVPWPFSPFVSRPWFRLAGIFQGIS